MRRRRGLPDAGSSALIRQFRVTPGLFRRLALVALLAYPVWAPRAVCAQETVSALPPPVTRGLYRSRWFEFLNAHLEDDGRTAAAALADMKKTASAVGVHSLSDFSRTAVHEARKAEAASRVERARRAYAAALELDDANLDAHLSRVGFLLRRRAYLEAARLVPDIGMAMLATHESRLMLFSSLAIWAAAGFAAAIIAFVLVLIVRHLPRIAHNLQEIADRRLGSGAALPLFLVLLALPFAFGLGPVWAALCWGVLVFPYASRAERWVLSVALVLLAAMLPMLSALWRESIIERSPLYIAAVDLEERREDASAEDGLRQASVVFSEESDVWFLLGMYAERSGDSERAVAAYDRAIQADPRDYRPFLNRGNVHFQEGDLSEAIQDYNAAGQRAPRAAEVYYNLSIARSDAYDFDGRAAAIARAREISESSVRAWTNHPTLARVVSASYPLSRARKKIEEWNAQRKSRRLPGHAPPLQPEILLSPLTLGPLVLLALALSFARALPLRRSVASECARCGKAFCFSCKKAGEPVLYCSECVRLNLRRESSGIETQMAQTQEIRRRTRLKNRACRIASFLLPGAHLGISGRPVASFATLFLFFFLLAIAAINVRFFDLRPFPPAHARRAITFAPLVVAALVWLWSQWAAWRKSHGS